MKKILSSKIFFIPAALVILAAAFMFLRASSPFSAKISYSQPKGTATSAVAAFQATSSPAKAVAKAVVVTHVKTPQAVKAIYMTAWTAGDKTAREALVNLIGKTELNAVVIDIKDYTGRVSYIPKDPALIADRSSDGRISDIEDFIAELHSKNIYVIGRIESFQDSYMAGTHPGWAVEKANDKPAAWKDNNGLSWIDPGATPMWDYLVSLGKDAYSRGFDELNYDYIRFPSDGPMSNIYYPWSGMKAKPAVLKGFYSYLTSDLKPTGAVVSADLFGLTTSAEDDMGIGQILGDAAKYFDYVAPMVYPSHFATGFIGYKNPADYPYQVIKYSMDNGVKKVVAASSTPDKLRPWLQDFNMGAVYTASMIREEMQAVYDSGLSSWMLWSASNKYTVGALDAKNSATSTKMAAISEAAPGN